MHRHGVCIDATVMTSISLVAGVDLFWPPWSSHWSMEPGPWDDVHPFSPKAKGPGPPEVTAAANSMLSIRGSPAPPSGPVQFSTSACMPSPAARKTKTKTWSSKYRTQNVWFYLYLNLTLQVLHKSSLTWGKWWLNVNGAGQGGMRPRWRWWTGCPLYSWPHELKLSM